jgi:FMN phosphatase YigB (HAD superfamily)
MVGVGFSLLGTLVQADHVEQEAFERLCNELATSAGLSIRKSAVKAAIQDQPLLMDCEGVQLAEALSAALGQVFRRRAATSVVVARYRQLAGGVAAERAHALPGVKSVIEELERLAVPKAILTNGLPSIERAKASVLGFSGAVLVSEDIGVRKPEPAAFAALARSISLPVECIWFVGNEGDRRGAEAVGMNTVAHVEELLEAIREPYSRAMLGLRYVMRTVLDFRPGHYVSPDDPPFEG